MLQMMPHGPTRSPIWSRVVQLSSIIRSAVSQLPAVSSTDASWPRRSARHPSSPRSRYQPVLEGVPGSRRFELVHPREPHQREATALLVRAGALLQPQGALEEVARCRPTQLGSVEELVEERVGQQRGVLVLVEQGCRRLRMLERLSLVEQRGFAELRVDPAAEATVAVGEAKGAFQVLDLLSAGILDPRDVAQQDVRSARRIAASARASAASATLRAPVGSPAANSAAASPSIRLAASSLHSSGVRRAAASYS